MSETYVGIDLGTSFSCLAYTNGDSVPVVLKFENGEDHIPSTVTFADDGLYIGRDAINNGIEQTTWNTVSHFKRTLGEDINRTYSGVKYSPTELSAAILVKLLKEMKKAVGVNVRNAIITIPSDFGDVERHSTFLASKIAGLDDVHLISESLAVAISYGNEKKLDNSNILVYDFGCGTLNVAVVKISKGDYIVLSDESNKDLGGMDWDIEVAAMLQKRILENAGLKNEDVASDVDFRKIVMNESEIAKIALREETIHEGCIQVNGKDVNYLISRDEIEDETYSLMMKTIEMIGNAIRSSGLEMSDIDKVVMAGNSSLMPQVKKELKYAFPSADLVLFDPSFAVCKGAALFAESFFGEKKIRYMPVMTKTYGIVVGIDGEEKICNVSYKNDQIPSKFKIYCRPKREDQKDLDIAVYESTAKRGNEYIDIKEGKQIRHFNVQLKGKITRSTKIPIYVDIDKHGKITFTIECNNEKTAFTFVDEIELSDDEMKESIKKVARVI